MERRWRRIARGLRAVNRATTSRDHAAAIAPKLERADVTSNSYYEWFIYHDYIALAALIIIVPFLETFREFPPRQKPGSFSLDQALQRMQETASGRAH